MPLLESLAAGLRGAGGILDPGVYQSQRQEEDLMTRLNNQRQLTSMQLAARNRDMMIEQTIKAAENGAITPQDAGTRLQQLGFNIPVGPSLTAQKIREEFARRENIANEVKALPPEDRTNPLRLADIFITNGDYATGAKYIDTHEQRQVRMQQAKDALDARMTELRLRLNDQELNREQRSQIALMADDTKRAGQALQAQIAAGNQSLKELQIRMMGDKQKETQQEKEDKKVSQLGQRLEQAQLPAFDQTLNEVESYIARTPELLQYATGPKGMLPDIAVPAGDIRNGRNALNRLFNIELKNRSGAAVTVQELDRLKQEYAIGALKTPEQLAEAVKRARRALDQHYRGVAAGFPPEVLKQYNENIRAVGGRPIIEPETKSSDGWGIKLKGNQ